MGEQPEWVSELIVAIFNNAILDIVKFPLAKTNPEYKYHKGSLPYNSVDAKNFINKNNKVFQMYCDILEIDYGYAELNILKKTNELIKKRHLGA